MMMSDLKTPVSGRQFAKMVGQAESAVRKAVARQSIVAGRTPEGKFIPEVAAREWGKAILHEYGGSVSKPAPAVKQVVKSAKPKVVTLKPKPVKRGPKPKEKPLPITVEEFLAEDDTELPNDLTDEEIHSDPLELSERSTKVDADRVQAIYKAKMAEITYQKARGDLIPREKLKVLFEYGANIRSAIKNIPKLVLDDILANSHDRQVASIIFDEAIDKVLEELSDPEKLNL